MWSKYYSMSCLCWYFVKRSFRWIHKFDTQFQQQAHADDWWSGCTSSAYTKDGLCLLWKRVQAKIKNSINIHDQAQEQNLQYYLYFLCLYLYLQNRLYLDLAIKCIIIFVEALVTALSSIVCIGCWTCASNVWIELNELSTQASHRTMVQEWLTYWKLLGNDISYPYYILKT